MNHEDSLIGATAEEDQKKDLSDTREVDQTEKMSVTGEDEQSTIRRLQAMVDQQAACINHLTEKVNERVVHRPVVTKPRDIPILELQHLHGLESASRIELFFEQIETCSPLSSERIDIIKTRVSAELAMKLHALINKESITIWSELKQRLKQEFATELNFDRAWAELDNMKYDWEDSPQAFANKLICNYSILETKFSKESLPKRDPLIKRKLLRGMPSQTHEKLSSFMEEDISLGKFIDRLEHERYFRLTGNESKIGVVSNNSTIQADTELAELRKQVDSLTRQLERTQIPSKQMWCPYCRVKTHTVRECPLRPRYGACYDCLRTNCRQGKPRCPGRRSS